IMEASGVSDPLSIGQILQSPDLRQKVVIINKSDLTDLQSDELRQLIHKLNPFAFLVFTSYAKIEFAKYKPKLKFLPSGEKAENGRPELESEVIKSNRIISPEKLDEFIEIIKQDCIRCKGFINVDRDKKVFLQGTYETISVQDSEYFASPTEFFVIGNYDREYSFQKIFESHCRS
ncbi:MAG: GTP-binding protein, partial [Prolixibacteraceae bacterium]